MKIYTIIPKLLYQSAKTDNMTRGQKIETVSKLGIQLVVNLWHTPDPEMVKLVPSYIHEYFPDGKSPVYEGMEILANTIFSTHILKGYPVLVHCWGGRNRSGLLNAMLVMRLKGLSGEQAYDYIRQKRPNSLVNKHFATWLMNQGEYVKERETPKIS